VSASWLATRIYSYMSSSVVQLSPPIAPNQTECLLSLTRRWLCCCSIGGAPSIDNPQFVPSFPLQLAWLNITANLRKFDRRTVSNFIHIESPPGSWHEHHEVQNVTKSISEVYLYVAEVLDELCLEYGEKQVFIGDPARQVLATTAEGETVQQVTNMSGAKAALITIADQGSGCPVAGDTKGWPEVTSIFETPQEGGLAHFARFNEIRDGRMYARNDTWKTGGHVEPSSPHRSSGPTCFISGPTPRFQISQWDRRPTRRASILHGTTRSYCASYMWCSTASQTR
jgi:hypothetical protein